MRKILFLILAVCLSMTVSAQMPMATLDHNDTITVFYNHLALRNAYDAAVEGDIITLSEGEFDADFDFTKSNITLRGAGMLEDTVTGTLPTIVRSRITFKDSVSNCTLEGIYFNTDVKIEATSNFLVRKCRFNNVQKDGSDTTFGHNVYSCVIHYLDPYGTSWSDACWINSNFFNCIIAKNNENCSSSMDGNTGTIVGSHLRFINCYVQFYSASHAQYSAEYYNCILYACNGDRVTNLEAHNCIGLKRDGDNNFWDTTNTYNIAHNLINMSLSDVFVNFDGYYHPGVDNLELTPTAQAILGFDGTEIGIHGGTYPYNPHLDSVVPIIGHISVPSVSNSQGQLEMNVEIITEQ